MSTAGSRAYCTMACSSPPSTVTWTISLHVLKVSLLQQHYCQYLFTPTPPFCHHHPSTSARGALSQLGGSSFILQPHHHYIRFSTITMEEVVQARWTLVQMRRLGGCCSAVYCWSNWMPWIPSWPWSTGQLTARQSCCRGRSKGRGWRGGGAGAGAEPIWYWLPSCVSPLICLAYTSRLLVMGI